MQNKTLIVGGAVVGAVALVGAVTATLFLTNQNNQSSKQYSASNPDQLVTQFNGDVNELVTAFDTSNGVSNPTAILSDTPFAGVLTENDGGYQYNLEVSGSAKTQSFADPSKLDNSEFDMVMDGTVAKQGDNVDMEGSLDITVGSSGVAINVDGEYMYVDNTAYLKIGQNNLLATMLSLPEGWIKLNQEDARNLSGDFFGNPQQMDVTSDAKQAELEESSAEVKQIEDQPITNAKSAPAKTIEGVEVPCMTAEINKEYIKELLTLSEVDNLELPPFKLCIDGSDKPVYFEMSFSYKAGAGQDGEVSGTMKFSQTKLPKLPDITPPSTEEVTEFSEVLGKSFTNPNPSDFELEEIDPDTPITPEMPLDEFYKNL